MRKVLEGEKGVRLDAVMLARAGLERPPGQVAPSCLADADLHDICERLWNARAESLVVSDSQDREVQIAINFINHIVYTISMEV